MAEDLVGRTLKGRYMLVRAIGKGGMGVVYEAIHLDLGRKVAIKLLDVEAADARALQRFRQEALAAAAIQHPNVVSVTDFDPGSDDEPPFIAMELLPGRSLSSLLAVDGRLAPTRAVSVAVQMLEGLHAAHEQGIIHRDIKPANVFLVEMPGNRHLVKLLDFGIAKLLEDEHSIRTTTGSFLGTPSYVSPEQVLGGGKGAIDARTDVHAVSACLYEMLTGTRPFRAPSAAETIALILRPERPLIATPEVPRELADVVLRGLSRDRDARWPSARAMRDALAPWLEGDARPEPATAAAPQPTLVDDRPPAPKLLSAPTETETDTQKSRTRTVFAAALGATTLIGIAIAAVVVMSRPPPGYRDPVVPNPSTPSAPSSSTSSAPSSSSADADVDDEEIDGAAASASVSASASTPAPPPRLYNITMTADPSEVDPAAAADWYQKHGSALRQACGRRRSCAVRLEISSSGHSRAPFAIPRYPKPPGCGERVWDCVADYLERHPLLDPKVGCPPQGKVCEHHVIFHFE